MIDEEQLIEHAMVYGQHKGVPKAHVRDALASGQDVLMRVDVQGAATVRRRVPGAITVFLIASSEEELIERLRARGTDSPSMLERRISILREEMRRIEEFDYVVVNRKGQLDEAVRQIVTIMQAEKCRTDWRRVLL
jgi:guanylate kinase